MCLAISSDARVSIKRHFFCSFIDVPTLNLFVIIHLGYKISRLQNKSYFFYGHSVGNMRRNKINIYARPGQIIHQLRRGSDMYGSTKLILRENNDKRKKWVIQGFKVTHWPILLFKEAASQLKNYFYSPKQNILWMMMINWMEWYYFYEVPLMIYITNYVTVLNITIRDNIYISTWYILSLMLYYITIIYWEDCQRYTDNLLSFRSCLPI